jgi:hypothetical protein
VLIPPKTHAGFALDHHIIASITIFGMICDILGGLYLAYDLLGGPRGPLRRLTEIITISIGLLGTTLLGTAFVMLVAMQFNLRILTVLGFSGTFGVALGFGSGGGLGTALGYILGLTFPKRNTQTYGSKLGVLRVRSVWALVIGFTCALSASLLTILSPKLIYNFENGIGLGLSIGMTAGIIAGFLVARELLPSAPVGTTNRPAFDKAGPILGLIITIPSGLIIATTYWITYGPYDLIDLLLALLIGGLVAVIGGLGGGFGIGIAKRVNWWVGKLAPTRMGTFGAFLIMGGFVLQLFQYVVTLLDIPIR